ncbi:hypothetical protein F9U64_20985 [Gracilibacillus oryzae]|uniref:Uncharacterized protein n=1 Tax=Gracilibacillus oryzae TaxID=1672701 RepID=A0A7C8KRB2_9BACI|nr:hypothetical protein [Gracilibacillus oryzae]KAB8126010.1 hypothetical protein F9U64_20985 [Gracilibacillus oryzae]
MRRYLIILFLPAILIGCISSPGQNEGGLLTKEQVLKLSPVADMFEWDGKVYKSGIDWIEEEDLTKEKQLGEIGEGMATKLPVGAKIFAPEERRDILIVEHDGKEKRYLLQTGE